MRKSLATLVPLLAVLALASWPRVAAATTAASSSGRAARRRHGSGKKGGTLHGPRYRRRRRQPRPRLLVLPDRLPGARPADPAAAVRLEARRRPRRRPTSPTALPQVSERRQDADGQDQDRASSTARRCRTGPSRPRTSSTRSSAASCRRSATATRTSTTATSRASKAYTDGKAKEISGIQTPDDTTLVLKLDRAVGRAGRPAPRSRCPCTVPVPKDYAQKYDKGKQSTYGEHQVFTGPYMIPNDGNGQDHRLHAGQDAHARPQPELGQVDRLPAGLLRQDRLHGRQRRHGRQPQDRSPARAC